MGRLADCGKGASVARSELRGGQMWVVGLMLLGAGLVGLFPTYGALQMPLWLSAILTIVGGALVLISPSSDTPEVEPAPHPQTPHQDERQHTAS